MSVAAIFYNNKAWFKLLAALAIPAGIAYFFWSAQQQANIDIKQVQDEQKANPNTEAVIIKNYGMKEVDGGNRVRWQLKSASGTIQPNGKDVDLEKVVVEYYDPATKEMKMRLSAPKGTANQETKFVQLNGGDGGKVVAEGGQGKCAFSCQTVELKEKNQFVATGGVIIEWPGVAKVSGNSATGSTNMSAGPKDFKVEGNTHAEIAVR